MFRALLSRTSAIALRSSVHLQPRSLRLSRDVQPLVVGLRFAFSRPDPARRRTRVAQEQQEWQQNGMQDIQASGATADVGLGADTGLTEVRQNKRLGKFMRRIFSGSAKGVFAAGVTAAIAAPMAVSHPYIAMFGGFGVGMFALWRIIKEGPIPLGPGVTDNSATRKAMMYTFFASQGVMVAPMVAMMAKLAPGTLLPAFLLSTATIAGSSFWALTRPSGSLLKWGTPLAGGLMGLIGLGLVNLIWPAPLFTNLLSMGGVALFTAINAYDTHQAIDDFKNGNSDHLLHSVNFFMNFSNLFVRFLQLLNMGGFPAEAGIASAPTPGADINAVSSAPSVDGGLSGIDTELTGLSDEALDADSGIFESIGDVISSVGEVVSSVTE